MPLLELANAQSFDKSRLIGVTCAEILNNANGKVCKFGPITGLDTSGYSANNILYLSTVDGEMTVVKPGDGAFVNQMAAVAVVDSEDGVIVVDINTSELTSEVTDTNGFPSSQRTNTTLGFTDGSRTFTITPTSSSFHFYGGGVKYEVTGADSVVISNTEGLHVIYYDGETLTSVDNPNDGQIDVAIRTKVLIAYIYWNATDEQSSYFADERHGILMSPSTHSYLHFTRGAQYLNGLGVGDIDTSGDGTLAADAQFSVAGGMIVDEDMIIQPGEVESTSGLPIYYLDGANANMRKVIQAGFPVYATSSPNGRLWWNEWTGSTWQLTEVDNNDFVLCHVFAINGIAGRDQQIAIIGQGEYNTVGQARAGATTEISTILTQLPVEEMIPIASIIYQTSTGYSNAVKARTRTTDTGEDFVDWRVTELAQGVTPSSHANLTDLELAASGSNWGHISDQLQTIAGIKNFSDNLGIGTTEPTEALDVNSDAIRVRSSQTPASASATGTQGQVCWDDNYIYVCIGEDEWKRSLLSTW